MIMADIVLSVIVSYPEPFNTSLPSGDDSLSPVNESWYHGQLSRQQVSVQAMHLII